MSEGRQEASLEQVKSGAAWLFWSVLLGQVLCNGTAFFWPAFNLGREYLFISRSLYALSGIGVLVGVVLTTRWRDPSGAAGVVPDFWRFFALADLGNSLFHLLIGWSSLRHFSLLRMPIEIVIDIGFMLCAMLYLSRFLKRFGQTVLAHRIRMAFWGYILVALFLDQAFTMSLGYLGSAALDVILLIWILTLLNAFRRFVGRLVDGRCLTCGYELAGLTEPRCPECGTSIHVAPGT